MPALPNVPSVLRVEVFWTVGADSHALSRLHWAYTGGAPSSADCATIAGDFWTSFNTMMLDFTPDRSLTGVQVTDLTTPSSGQGQHLQTSVGTAATGPLPAEVCGLASMAIARRYRGGKPRTYFPIGGRGDLLDAQTWLAASIVNWNASLTQIRANARTFLVGTTQVTELVNVSYYSGFTVRPNPIVPGVRAKNIPTLRAVPVVDVATGWAFEAKPASQRRRQLRSA